MQISTGALHVTCHLKMQSNLQMSCMLLAKTAAAFKADSCLFFPGDLLSCIAGSSHFVGTCFSGRSSFSNSLLHNSIIVSSPSVQWRRPLGLNVLPHCMTRVHVALSLLALLALLRSAAIDHSLPCLRRWALGNIV